MSAIAYHPRVAQLRGYPKPSKPSLPQESVQVIPKVSRSITKRAASSDLDQFVPWVSPKPVKKSSKPAPQPGQTNHRIPFRNVQNLAQSDDVPLSSIKAKKPARPLPMPPTTIITGRLAPSTPPRSLPPTPTSSTFVQNVSDARPLRSKRKFPSGFIDINGYNYNIDIENDYPGNSLRNRNVTEPVSRPGLYRYYPDPYEADIDLVSSKRAGDDGVRVEGKEMMVQECDIGEASPLDFNDSEEEEMTRELIRMLDF